DARADIYSLGCVLYECLVGSVPFVKEYDQAIVYSHQHDATPRASQLRPEIGEAIDDVIARATAKNPGDRYPSCRAMMDAAAQAFGLADSRPIRVATVISDQPPQATPPPAHAPWQTPPESQAAATPAPPAPAQPSWSGPPSWGPPPKRGWLTPALVALVALAMGAALASVLFLAT